MSSSTSVEIHRHTAASPWTYTQLDQYQREIAARTREGGAGALLISELAPVITLGRRSSPGDLTVSREALAASGVEVLATDRGGLATWHGPGQWVLFAVDRLERLTGDSRGVRAAVEELLEIAQACAREFGVDTEIRSGCETGVWSNRGKVASVGVRIERGVLLHGLSLNGYATEKSFWGLRPCGLDAPVDYVLGDGARFEELGAALERECLKRFWSARPVTSFSRRD